MITFIKHEYWSILLILNYLLATSAALVILLKNINPTKTISYIIVLVVFPFLGVLVYYLFGQEYRKNKIFSRKSVSNQNIVKSISKDLKFSKSEIKRLYDYLEDKTKLVRLLYNNENSPLTLKNNVDILKNGNEKFPKLIDDIRAAKQHVHLEYYIIKDDKIGTEILDLLCEKARNGVEVRLSYDDVGSSISSKTKKLLKESGVLFYPFMPVLFSKFTGKMNYRNHRKIAVIDGFVGYVGGINIDDEYFNDAESSVYWRDTHMRIEGEAVKALQFHFLTTWDFVSNTTLKINRSYFPEVHYNRNVAIQIAASGPDTDWANIMEVIFTAISTAKDYVYITTPYFVPNDEIIMALQVAAKSGIDVKLIIPKESDSWLVKHATNSYLEKLLEANIKVYRYTKGFIHAKTIVIDDIFSTVGTSNMDYRSFNINFEINAFMYNIETSKVLKQQFLEDLNFSEIIEHERWLNRPNLEKLKESYSRLWSPLI